MQIFEATTHALHLADGPHATDQPQVVDRVDGDDEVERSVAIRQVVRAAHHEERFDVIHRVLDGIGREIETGHADTGDDLTKVVEEKPLGAADVEDDVPRPETVEVPHPLSDRDPPAIVAIPAIPLSALPVEILAAEFSCELTLVGLGRLPGGDVAPHPRVAVEKVDLAHRHTAPKAASVARSPSLNGVNTICGTACRRRAIS